MSPFSSNSDTIGFYRNDSVAKKVFYIPNDSLMEHLLYDFNLLSGDTIKGYMDQIGKVEHGPSFYAVVDSIDSLLVDGNYRRRWNYHTETSIGVLWGTIFSPTSIIEGIGSTGGLLEGLLSQMDWNGSLQCYSENGVLFYGWGPCLPLGEAELTLNQNINIHPNPTKDWITVSLEEGTATSVTIRNSLGQLLLSDKTLSTNQIELDLSYWDLLSAT
jgi:hypothetical protein